MRRVLFLVISFHLFSLGTIYAQKQLLDVMPVPKHVELGEGWFEINSNLKVGIQGNPHHRIYAQTNRFLNRLGNKTGTFLKQGYADISSSPENPGLLIKVNRPAQVKFGEDESYQLSITDQGIQLDAETDIGAIYGLETLLQIIKSDSNGYYFPSLKIEDSPRFPWRGLMIDVARHFQPVAVIKRNIDGMAAVKMNVLHLHLSDDQGFRVESKLYPKLTSMGSDGFYYTQEQIKDIVRYADERGIRVYPEFDVPGHATAILTAYPEFASKEMVYQIERNAGVFDPTLDPTNPKTYEFLNNLFAEMASLFPDNYFHIGGDENEGKHWNENKDIQRFMRKKKIKDNHALQAYFNKNLLKNFETIGKKMVGWDEIIHEDLPNTAVIQSWRGLDNMEKAAKSGYKTMLSNGFYIDLMHAAEKHYLVEPLPDTLDLTEEERSNIIGGEATMWSELVTPYTIDSRIWPRTAAIAERLWSPKEVRDVDEMYRRMDIISLHLEQLGLQHLSSRDLILRNIANQTNIKPLQVLTGVCQPLQGYTRNPGGTMYQSYSPFLLFADACIADPPDAYNFNKLVEQYLAGEDENLKAIINYLSLWEANNDLFVEIAENTPILNEIAELSVNLSDIAGIGREALKYILEEEKPGEEWIERSRKISAKARKQGGRTELKIVGSIEQLIINCQ
ncbi:MAG: family 20 glycosylhydrolase [Bacteroidota bacterium]